MSIYLIKITMPDGSRGSYRGLFEHGCEAACQALADWPEANRIAVFFLMHGGV